MFLPLTPSAGDPSLAADAWTNLFPETPGIGTRTGFRSLDATEQRRVLAVGLCLPCHPKATVQRAERSRLNKRFENPARL